MKMDQCGCSLVKHEWDALYDLTIYNGDRIVEVVKNITFQRAVTLMEDAMYCKSYSAS